MPDNNQPAPAAPPPPSPTRVPDAGWLPLVLLLTAVAIVLGTGMYWMYAGKSPGYTGGGAAAAAGVLFVVALVLARPTLIMDDAPDAGGEPSTMRLLSLIIIVTFCAVMVRSGWNSGSLPSLEAQGNWVWLVTAALGGKALQKFAEVQEKKK